MMRIAAICAICMGVTACAAQREQAARNDRLADTHMQLGAAYMQRGQLEVAGQELEKALEADPNNTQANNMMALLQVRLRNYERAERHFLKAVERDPGNSEAQNNYGAFLCERARYDEAEQRFRKAIDDPLYKTPELANLNAGLCLMKKPAPKAAEKYFRAALALQPRLAQALLQMARISYDSGQSFSARAYIQRYFDVAKETPETLLLAINIERALGNRELLKQYTQRLTAGFPESAEAQQLKRVRGGR